MTEKMANTLIAAHLAHTAPILFAKRARRVHRPYPMRAALPECPGAVRLCGDEAQRCAYLRSAVIEFDFPRVLEMQNVHRLSVLIVSGSRTYLLIIRTVLTLLWRVVIARFTKETPAID